MSSRKHDRFLPSSSTGEDALVLLAVVTFAVALLALVLRPFASPARTYSDADFGIEPYVSPMDTDGDGVDDQADILASARNYVATRPAYASAYYAGGWPDDGRGVCTDVVAQALLGAGIDLRFSMAQDMGDRPSAYAADAGDIDIAFRRVRNQVVWLDAHATSLSTDTSDIAEWRGGDIVAYGSPEHVAIVSDRRDADGRPLVIHHGSPWQSSYEEDRLGDWGGPVGHWRVG